MGLQAMTYLVVGITFAIYIGIAVWARAGSTSEFYSAGGNVGPVVNGMAIGADWMSAASFISMAGLIANMGWGGGLFLMGWTGGYVLLAMLLAPYLRKFGKYTVPAFVSTRYYSRGASLVAVLCLLAASLTYIIGQMTGVGVAFSRFLGVSNSTGIYIGMGIVFLYAVFGGMKGITYTQVAQYCVLILAYTVPAIFISMQLTGNPIPQLGLGSGFVGTDMSLLGKLDQVVTGLGFGKYTTQLPGSMLNMFVYTVSLMIGTAGLPHVIMRFFTVATVKDARYSAGWALIFIGLLYTTAPAVAAMARLNLHATVNKAVMQQDGDLFDEDVATIDDAFFSAKSELFSFGKSKRLLATKVYPTHQKAFYSNCDYRVKEKKLIPLPKTCGFKYRKNKNRSERIEWEHVVPAWHFGHQLRCWQNGGRMTCRKTNTKFKQMEADMHNLVPAIGEINGDRSNYKYSMIEGEKRAYGKVNMEIEFSNKKAEPSETVFGDIARTYFYMRDRYGLRISKSQEKMFIAWNNMDPVTAWEKKRNQLIKELQGDENLYVSNYKTIEQLGTIHGDVSTNYDEVKEELSEEYASILDKLSPPFAGGLLFLLTLFTLYKRKQAQEKNSHTSKEIEKKEEQKEPVHSKSFLIISKLGNVAISVNDDNQVIIEETDKNNPNQCWEFTKANKQKEYFFIENSATGKVIEIDESNSNDGAKVIMNKKKSRKNDHQEWMLETSKDKGYVFIVNKWALNVLDVKYKKTTNGNKLQSFHKKVRGTENQEWKIEKI